jgi:cytochrome P450
LSYSVANVLVRASGSREFVRIDRDYSNNDHDNLDAFVLEVLCFETVGRFVPRLARKDFTVAKGAKHEYSIKTGNKVLAVKASAMFDEDLFENSEELNFVCDNSGHYSLWL